MSTGTTGYFREAIAFRIRVDRNYSPKVQSRSLALPKALITIITRGTSQMNEDKISKHTLLRWCTNSIRTIGESRLSTLHAWLPSSAKTQFRTWQSTRIRRIAKTWSQGIRRGPRTRKNKPSRVVSETKPFSRLNKSLPRLWAKIRRALAQQATLEHLHEISSQIPSSRRSSSPRRFAKEWASFTKAWTLAISVPTSFS